MIKNKKQLEAKIEELTQRRQSTRSSFLDTSDKTRQVAGSVQRGMYLGQMALGIFRTLTNFRLPPKKRIQSVIVTLATIVVANAVRKLIIRKFGKKA